MVPVYKTRGFKYIFRFLFLFAGLYTFHQFYIGLVAPGGSFYSPFCANHLNYIAWLRSLILHGSNVVTHLFGMNTFVDPPFKLRVINGSHVFMGYDCIGFGVMSFWMAFVFANHEPFVKKSLWCIYGLVGIFIINCMRVALVLAAFQYQWKAFMLIDHHTLFNITAYIVLFMLIFLYTRASKTEAVA